MSRIAGVAVVLALASPAYADLPGPAITLVHPVQLDDRAVPNVVNSHTLFLNNCQPNGCALKVGNTNATTLTSDIPSSNTTLSAFSGTAQNWSDILACVTMVMKPFNITVTDKQPTSGDYFEVIIAGDPRQMGLPCDASGCVLGIADYPCQQPIDCGRKYIPDALVFDFANVAGPAMTTLVCGTAAQEIAHAWTLDHATPATDPMTYNNYVAPLKFQDAAPCGSDCLYSCPGGTGTCNAFGVPCTSGRHTCMSSGQSTQDEIKIISALMGPAGAVAPTLTVSKPVNGGGIQAGGEIDVTCTSSDGIEEVDYSFDGVPAGQLTTAPFTFNVTSSAKDGSHTITIMCTSNLQASSTQTLDVLVGAKCSSDSDCNPNYICYDGACVAGPMAMGGLGATCSQNSDCQSGSCASDGSKSACVVPCDTSSAHCPSGFGCVGVGSSGTAGVCFPGADSGGCCDAGSTPTGPLLLGGLVALVMMRRRKVAS